MLNGLVKMMMPWLKTFFHTIQAHILPHTHTHTHRHFSSKLDYLLYLIITTFQDSFMVLDEATKHRAKKRDGCSNTGHITEQDRRDSTKAGGQKEKGASAR